jgi:OmcA/MtrC family decaheme c-type cytochrome
VASNAAPATDASAAAWAALQPQVTVTGVTIASPPVGTVVTFKVTDADGTPIVGLGNVSQSTTATLPGLTNLAFALAKLVPGSNGSPNRWVTYIVTSVPTYKKAQPDPGNDTSTNPAAPRTPTTDNTGTLVDQGLQNPNDATKQGVYTYTFTRDVTQIKAQVDAMTVAAPNNKADLGDLLYDPTLVHRLAIQLSGNAPGTGTNTPTGVAFSTVPGTPLTKPFDAIYDFVPVTNSPVAVTDSGRDIVATAKCQECHRQLGGIPGDSSESSGALFHGGNRNDTRYCVVCHTEQLKYGSTEAAINSATLTFTDARTSRVDDRALGNLPNHIHHIHMGTHLAKKNYNFGGVLYNETLFPQDLRNCTKCHDGSATSTAPTKQGNNWQNVPNRLACGGCHDGINFATGMGVTIADAEKGLTSTTSFGGFAHGGKAQADDSLCATCHTPGNIDIVHTPVTPPDPQNSLDVALVQGETTGNNNTNAAWIASNTSRLPAGAIKITYDIKSVSRNASKQPVIVFRILQNGLRKDFNTFVPNAADPIGAQASQEMLPNFMGSPSAQFVFAVPQDNITMPADFNAAASGYLRSIWNGAASGSGAGAMTGPDGQPDDPNAGYYTVTLTGVVVPDNAVMLTGGIGYSYSLRSTLPLTQTNLADYPVAASTLPVSTVVPVPSTSPELLDPRMTNKRGGLIVIAPNAQKVASAGCTAGSAGGCTSTGGYTGRRPIVEDARCNKCHQELGTFTTEAFHGGQRNDGTTCAWCHTPNRTSSGWAADSTSYIHAIHAAAKRDVPFTWDSSSTTESFADVKFPGVLKDCETCHLPGTYNFSASASASALPNRLYRTVATGIFNGTAGTLTTGCTVTTINDCLQTALGVFRLSPYVIRDNTFNYGAGFSVAAGTGVPTNAAGTTLVNSPIATQCFSCHDSTLASAHIELGGGSIYAPRTAALATTETCMVCHDVGRIADIKVMHAK